MKNKAIFLDRDGVINVDKGYVWKIEDFEIIEGVIDAIKEFHKLGYYVIVITNQSGIARGYFSEEDMFKFHKYIDFYLKKNNTYIDAYYYCPHHPSGNIDLYKKNCDCRKPLPGLILKAAKDFHLDLSQCIMIGDKKSDIEAGNRSRVKKSFLFDRKISYKEIIKYIINNK